MTILPTKVKKIRKEDKRVDEWVGPSGQSSSLSHRLGISTNGVTRASHSTHSHSHQSSHAHGPPRKFARIRKRRVSSSHSSLNFPSHPSPTHKIVSPRGSREENDSFGKEDYDGPNSDDEYDRGFRDEEMERDFESRLKDERGLEIKKMVGDGACLFRGVSHQIYGDEEMHGEVRRLCLDYMEKNKEHFEQFITEDFGAYIARKRRPAVHGNHVELQAISEIYNRPIEIYEYNINPINVFHPKSNGVSSSSGGTCSSSEKKEKEGDMNAPIRLSYHGSTHYNAVIDPRVATVGVGLGLPSFDPGLADRQLIANALSTSDMQKIEQAMLNDKLSMTDWERTEEDLKDQVLRESYLEYARSLEECNLPSTSFYSPSLPFPSPSRPPSRPSSRPSSISVHHSSSNSPRTIISSSPQPCSSKCDEIPDRSTPSGVQSGCVHPQESSLYEELLMAEALEWNDDTNVGSSLAEALLLSQQTFFTECRRRSEGEGG